MNRIVTAIWTRMYADFFRPDRLQEYREFLDLAAANHYTFHSVISFYRDMQAPQPQKSRKRLVLRHDVDTDVKTAKAIWEIEQKAGARSSFYFRLSTVDASLMQAIERSGSEASYHYEELATVVKRRGLRGEDVMRCLPCIQAEFRQNLLALRARTGLPMQTVASHGDFMNRRLGMSNTMLVPPGPMRGELGILVEAYDDAAMSTVTLRCCDGVRWRPCDPTDGLRRGEHTIYVLTHPKHWRTNRIENLLVGGLRLCEEITFATRRLMPNRSCQ